MDGSYDPTTAVPARDIPALCLLDAGCATALSFLQLRTLLLHVVEDEVSAGSALVLNQPNTLPILHLLASACMHFIHCHCPMASALSRLCRHAALPPKSSEIRPASPAPLESSFLTSPRKAMPARRCRRTTTRDDGAIKASVSEHFRLSHDASPPMLAVPRLWRCPDGLPWFGVQARARSSGIEIVDS